MNYIFKTEQERLVTRPDIRLYAGNVNTYTFSVIFDSAWDNFVKFGVFSKDENSYVVPITGGKLTVPHEILTEPSVIEFNVFATNGEDDIKRICSNTVELNVLSGICGNMLESVVPTPDFWELALRHAAPKITDGKWYVYDILSDSYTDTGIRATGPLPEKGVDYFTDSDIASLGIGNKQDKSQLIKLSDIDSEADLADMSVFSDDKYVSAAFIPKIIGILLRDYLTSDRINTLIGNLTASVNNAESTQNRVNAISDSPQNSKYPTEKAVSDFVDESIRSAIIDSWNTAV